MRHVFRLLEAARKDDRTVPWVLLENVCTPLHTAANASTGMLWCMQSSALCWNTLLPSFLQEGERLWCMQSSFNDSTLCRQVEGLLDRIAGQPPVIEFVASELERLGYSWAHRTINAAGFLPPCQQAS